MPRPHTPRARTPCGDRDAPGAHGADGAGGRDGERGRGRLGGRVAPSSCRHDVWSTATRPTTPGRQPVRIGVLTGGGGCPRLHAVIPPGVRTPTTPYGSSVIG